MKDRSILSALHDGEIHHPFEEPCRRLVESDPALTREYEALKALSTRLQEDSEPDFKAGESAAWERLSRRTAGFKVTTRPARTFDRITLSWPAAAAAVLVIGAGALGLGWGLKSSADGLVAQETLRAEKILTASVQNPAETYLQVPKKFTLPSDQGGGLLLSSFEGGD